MKKRFFCKISAFAAALTVLAGSIAAGASDYARPWSIDMIGNVPSQYWGGNTLKTWANWGPNNNRGVFYINRLYASSAMSISSVSDGDDYYIKLDSNLSYAEQASAGNGTFMRHNVRSDGYRSGWNGMYDIGGNTHGKVTYRFDMKMDKNAKWFDAESGAQNRADYDFSMYVTSGGDSMERMGMIGVGLFSADDDGENSSKYPVTLNAQCTAQTVSSPDGYDCAAAYLDLSRWYSFEMNIDVPQKSILYSVRDESGEVVLYHKSDLGALWYDGSAHDYSSYADDGVCPAINFTDIKPRGMDISFDNMIVEKEMFLTKDASLVTENGTTKASVSVASDVWTGDNSDKSEVINYPFKSQTDLSTPRLVVVLTDENGLCRSMAVSEQGNVADKAEWNSEPSYTEISVSVENPEGYSAKAYLWDSLNGMRTLADAIEQ